MDATSKAGEGPAGLTARRVPYLLFTLVLSVFSLGLLAVEPFVATEAGTRQIIMVADTVVCGLFFLDFLLSLYWAENRRRYLTTWGLFDLASSIPLFGFLRLARFARIARILRVLRALRGARMIGSMLLERRVQTGLLAATLIAILFVVTGSIAVLQFESTADSNIKTPADAVWWAIVTVTTVGYGDKYPVTLEGRLVATLLMVAGVGLFGTVSGSIAAWFLAPLGQANPSQEVQHKEGT